MRIGYPAERQILLNVSVGVKPLKRFPARSAMCKWGALKVQLSLGENRMIEMQVFTPFKRPIV